MNTASDTTVNVLLVEDNPGDVTLIERHLGRADTTLLASTVELEHVDRLDEAADYLQDRSVDVVLLDLGLPESNGLTTLERMVAIDDSVPVIVLTGLDANDAAVEAIRNGAQDYLTKGDFDGDLLVRTIRYAIERKANERRIERQNERLERFASVLSHDLRNPLNVASGRLDLVREQHDSEHLDEVASMHERMTALIDDVLELARQGQRIGDRESVGVGEVADDAWAGIESGDASVRVVDSPTVAADPERLRALFENLFRNAVEHGSTSPDSQARQDAVEHGPTSRQTQSDDAIDHGGDTVQVTVGGLDDSEGFFVADDGPGIPEADRDAVFEHGYTTDDDGTGFGLSIVSEIARAHDWVVRVTESESGGARFEFETPPTASFA